jgi:hypothetical protein
VIPCFKKNYKKALWAEIISRISFEGYTTDDGRPFDPHTDDDKILLLLNVARDEVKHEFESKGLQGGLEYWLSGLPSCIDLPVYYGEIMEFAVKIGSVSADYTEKEAEKIMNGFYRFIAANILQMHTAAIKRRTK